MTTNLKVCMCTWNVGEADPPENFTHLLGLSREELPAIYAIGLQEIKSSFGAIASDAVFDDPWTVNLTKALHMRKYVRISSIRLMGIHMVVFVKRQELPFVTNIETQYTRTGFGGTWGNKGGVSVRMDIRGVNICIVNCHLAAHQERVVERIEDYQAIVESQMFQDQERLIIMDHDYVFWIGDLNFRIDGIPNQEIKDRIAKGDLQSMWENDQLKKLMKEERILLDFEEGPLNFDPTYKFDFGTDVYDTSKKQRKPAWCDRILWMCHEDTFEEVSLSVKQLSYRSHPEYKNSDHKPVVSHFVIQVLEEPPPLQVRFEHVEDWTHTGNGIFTYTTAEHFDTSTWDWIAIYKTEMSHLQDYVTYVWAPKDCYATLDDGRKRWRAVFDRSYVQECKGRYCLMYYSSNKNSTVGCSETFKIATKNRKRKVQGFDTPDGLFTESESSTTHESGSESESDEVCRQHSDSDSCSEPHDVPRGLKVPLLPSGGQDSDSNSEPYDVPRSQADLLLPQATAPGYDYEAYKVPRSQEDLLLPQATAPDSDSDSESYNEPWKDPLQAQQKLTDLMAELKVKESQGQHIDETETQDVMSAYLSSSLQESDVYDSLIGSGEDRQEASGGQFRSRSEEVTEASEVRQRSKEGAETIQDSEESEVIPTPNEASETNIQAKAN